MDEDIAELKAMTRQELDLVMYDLKKWCCQVKGCVRGTHVRDYGISPHFLEHKKKGRWMKISTGIGSGGDYLLCFKHTKFWDRLIKNFDEETVFNKLFDNSISSINKMIDCKINSYNKNNIEK
jgi:hypothetical protein